MRKCCLMLLVALTLLCAMPDVARAGAPPPSSSQWRWQTERSASPDGRWVASMTTAFPPAGNGDLYYRQLVVERDDAVKKYTVIDVWSEWGQGYTIPRVLHWSRDGRFLYFTNLPIGDGCGIVGNAGDVQQLDLRTGRVTEILGGFNPWVEFASDDRRLVTIRENQLHLLDLRSGRQQTVAIEIDEGSSIGPVAWSPDGRRLALTISDYFCGPFFSKSTATLTLDTRTLKQRTLRTQDAQRRFVEGWRDSHTIELRNLDQQTWLMDAGSGQLRQTASNRFPAEVGTIWVYSATRYDGFNPSLIITATRRITDTLVSIKGQVPYQALEIRREESAESLVSMRGNYPITDSLRPMTMTTYWVAMETYLLQQFVTAPMSTPPDPIQVPTWQTFAELQFPLEQNAGWCGQQVVAIAAQGAPCWPDFRVTPLNRIQTPAGVFRDCHAVTYAIGGSQMQNTFCPGIGWVIRQDDHAGTPFGSKFVLIGFKRGAKAQTP